MVNQNVQQSVSGSGGSPLAGRGSFLSAFGSPLKRSLSLGAVGGRRSGKKSVVATLSLTSLIDAFSIIVIYLLIATTTSQIEVPVPANMDLPKAEVANVLEDTPLIRFESGKYYVNEKQVEESQLAKVLFDVKQALLSKLVKAENFAITVQADNRVDFSKINPLLVAASEAGIQKIKFAVVPTK